jgi:hypothetical protein
VTSHFAARLRGCPYSRKLSPEELVPRLPTFRLSDPEPEVEGWDEVEGVRVQSRTPSSPNTSTPQIESTQVMDPIDVQRRLNELEIGFQRQQEEATRRHEELRALLMTLGGAGTPQPNPEVQPELRREPQRDSPTPTSGQASGVKASLPADYDGARKTGRAFLNSCELYMQLAGAKFANDQQKIHWALTFCKTGRAANFADRILRAEKKGQVCYATWSDFVTDFAKRFCEANEQVRALTKLEGESWYQKTSSVDDYIDTFEELVDLAGLVTDAGLVMKFRRGLAKEIQDKVAEMESPPPWMI